MVQRVLAPCLAALTLAVAVGSCSSNESDGPGPGVGGQAGTPQQDASESEEAAVPLPDVQSEPETAVALCPAGSWGNVPDTKCSLIAQDCELGQSCTAMIQNGQPSTKCLSSNNGLKTRGEPCANEKECAAGLKCIFGYCSPYCCKEAQFELCGPGGLCMVNNNVDTSGEYIVTMCSYLKPCTLWAHDCPQGQGCHVIAEDGSGACTPPPGDEFLPEGAECKYANDCGDNQICITPSAAPVSTCRYLCVRGAAPQDAGAADAGGGDGGCLAGQKCAGITDYPPWLGVCIPQAVDAGIVEAGDG